MDSILAICVLSESCRWFINQTYLCIPSTTRCCCFQRQSKLYSGQDASRTKQQTALRSNNCCCVYCPINNLDESAAAHPHVVAYHVSRAPHSRRLHILHPLQRQPALLQQGFVAPSRVRALSLAVRQRGRLSGSSPPREKKHPSQPASCRGGAGTLTKRRPHDDCAVGSMSTAP